MTISLQQLRSVTPGVAPSSLLPGQLCLNLVDKLMFVGDGSDFKTSFDGTQVPGVPGSGWFSVPLTFSELDNYYIVSPQYYGDIPSNGQSLVWDSGLGHAIWASPSESNPVAYLTDNAAVSSAPGATLSSKISNALGVTPKEGDSVIVQGDPGDAYQGFYQFISGKWEFAAQYAIPEAIQVPFTPVSGLTGSNVQTALTNTFVLAQTADSNATDALAAASAAQDTADTALADAASSLTVATNALQEADSAQQDATAAQVTANLALAAAQLSEAKADDAIQTADNALAVANLALPKSGGTMTGNITFNNGQPVDAGSY